MVIGFNGADCVTRDACLPSEGGWTDRPWGAFEVLGRGPGHQIKRLWLAPGGVLSLQHHAHRAEHWVVVCGRGMVRVGDVCWEVAADDHVRIPAGSLHRLECMGDRPLVVVEVQTGPYLGEDDIVRHEDRYGRVVG